MNKKEFTYNRIETGKRIRERRLILGMTLEEIANQIGRVPKYCADIERGTCGMSIETMIAFSTILQLPLDYMIFGNASEEDKELFYHETFAMMKQIEHCPEHIRKDALQILRLYLSAYKKV